MKFPLLFLFNKEEAGKRDWSIIIATVVPAAAIAIITYPADAKNKIDDDK